MYITDNFKYMIKYMLGKLLIADYITFLNNCFYKQNIKKIVFYTIISWYGFKTNINTHQGKATQRVLTYYMLLVLTSLMMYILANKTNKTL